LSETQSNALETIGFAAARSKTRDKVVFIHRGAWGDLYVSTAALFEVCKRHHRDDGERNIWIVGSKAWLEIIDFSQWSEIAGIIVSENGWNGELIEYQGQKNSVWLPAFFLGVGYSYNLRTESLRYAWAPFLARVPVRCGTSETAANLLYTHPSPWLGKDPVIHERDRMLDVVRNSLLLDSKVDWSGKGLPVLKSVLASDVLRVVGCESKKYWLINPTSSRIEKAWPAERYRELALRLRKLLPSNMDVLVLGAPNETHWLTEIAQEDFRILQPKSISDLMIAVAGASQLIANTSSVQFLASAFDTPVLTLLGRAHPKIWGPLGRHSQSVSPKNYVEDASLNIFQREAQAYECISVEDVLEALGPRRT
jgi:ADP-heptose:LPS heptosyltransferase